MVLRECSCAFGGGSQKFHAGVKVAQLGREKKG
jgi:hypothetical protein